ncbi:MAG: YicC family protein [Ferrovum sp.]|jgi:uncharacterized protein (TIGR00255 family)|nr:YicC family protein [Ferrovum sp.]
MTGYSSVQYQCPAGLLNIEIRSVNHRFLDIQCRLPAVAREFEPYIRERLGQVVSRGKVEFKVDWKPNISASESSLSNEVLNSLKYKAAIIQEVFPEAAPLTLGEILLWPGLTDLNPELPSDWTLQFHQLTDQAIQSFISVRQQEGAKLVKFLQQQLSSIREMLTPLAQQIPQYAQDFELKLRQRLTHALNEINPDRLHQEIISLMMRLDIMEEINRLQSHCEAIEHILTENKPIGKKLDFITQELHREANTIGSKIPNIALSEATITLKVLIEQMREQIQNIE